MESGSPVVYHGAMNSNESSSKKVTELSPEEIRILKECNRESFFYRCVPFSFVGMAATYIAVKRGVLAPHPKYGPAFKMTGAAFLGWVLGKFSYRKQCEDKFLHLQNSSLADMIRKQRGYTGEMFKNEHEVFDNEDIHFKDKFSYSSDSEYYPSSGSLNLDVDKNVQYPGFDDRERPSVDSDIVTEEKKEPVRKFTSYEELRRRNREESERSHQPVSSKTDSTLSNPPRSWGNLENTPSKRFDSDLNEGRTKNIYGDSWENSKYS